MHLIMQDPAREKVKRYIAQERLIEPGQPVLVAVSGGADSVALLLLLIELGYPVAVAHFDHQTRAGESAADQRFVAELAAHLGRPFHAASQPVAAEAQAAGESFETCARRLRYAWLVELARERGIPALATGHHLDDQAETVLMRLLRGAGHQGLSGIPPLREEQGVRIVRPLLVCRRADLEAYLLSKGQAWRTDLSNTDPAYLRNRVRHSLLPDLRTGFNAQVDDALVRFAENARADHALLEVLATAARARCFTVEGHLDRVAFASEHPAIQRRLMAWTIETAGGEATYDRIVDAVAFAREGVTGAILDIGRGRQIYAGRRLLRVLSDPAQVTAPVLLPMPGEAVFLGRHFEARALDAPPAAPLKVYCGPARQVFDLEALVPPLSLRAWHAGDRFQPFGMRGTRKLQDYFVDKGIDAPARASVPLLRDADHILWVVGHAIDARGAVTGRTTRFLEVTVEPCD
jgi:tRNA(Ile)-lysidine synthase